MMIKVLQPIPLDVSRKVMSNFMDVHIKNLRKKIGDVSHDTLIRTIRGVGYIIKDEAE